MSAPGSLPEHLNPAEFARTGSTVQGSIALGTLDRLRESLASQDGRVNYALTGTISERGHDALVLKLSASLVMKCQRCLEAVPVTLESSHRIVFTQDVHVLEAGYEAEDTDVVEAVDSVEIAQLVEDEVLLSMPFSPMHDAGECEAALGANAQERGSPFSVLANLARPATRN